MKELDNALDTLQQALQHAADASLRQLQYECHEALSQVYEMIGSLDLALSHYKEFHTIKESILSEATRKALIRYTEGRT
jgi:tetratricopeptide (TPR) repeat protein